MLSADFSFTFENVDKMFKIPDIKVISQLLFYFEIYFKWWDLAPYCLKFRLVITILDTHWKLAFITKTDFKIERVFYSFFFSVAGFCSFFGEIDETSFRRLKDSRTNEVIIRNFLVKFLLLNDEI